MQPPHVTVTSHMLGWHVCRTSITKNAPKVSPMFLSRYFSEKVFCESGEGVRLPRDRADFRGSPGNFQGSLGKFRGSPGTFQKLGVA